MAERRSFSNKITGSDAFAELSFEAQALYMHLTMAADDDGTVASPKKVQKGIGASVEALEALIGAGYILVDADGICKIDHWDQTTEAEDAAERARKSNRERVRRYRARRKAAEDTATEYAGTALIEDEGEDRVAPCNADVTPCNVTVTLHTVTPPSPLSAPPSFPLLSSPHTPLYTTPYYPPRLNPSPFSSSSVFSARAQELALEYWGRKLKKYEKAELRRLSLGIAQAREGTEAGELCLSYDDLELLALAFSASAEAGVCSLTYLRGVFGNWHEHGILTSDAYWENEVERDRSSGKLYRGFKAPKEKGASVC